jgi:hypothetical protein
MQLVRFLRTWGAYVEGDALFVGPDLFSQLTGNGVAEGVDEAPVPAPVAPVVERATAPLPNVETADLKK